MADSPLADFRRYAGLIAPIVAREFEFSDTAESASAIQVERGTVLPLMLQTANVQGLARVERLIQITRSARLDTIAIIDRLGHHRPIYRPLLAYAWLSAFSLRY